MIYKSIWSLKCSTKLGRIMKATTRNQFGWNKLISRSFLRELYVMYRNYNRESKV